MRGTPVKKPRKVLYAVRHAILKVLYISFTGTYRTVRKKAVPFAATVLAKGTAAALLACIPFRSGAGSQFVCDLVTRIKYTRLTTTGTRTRDGAPRALTTPGVET